MNFKEFDWEASGEIRVTFLKDTEKEIRYVVAEHEQYDSSKMWETGIVPKELQG